MRILVVYESLFGNSRKVAEAVADALRTLRTGAEVITARTDEATPEMVKDADCLVVGGPTHNMHMSSERSREQGVQRAIEYGRESQIEPHAVGVREWLAGIDKVADVPAVAFDTCVASSFSGHASKHIAPKLKAKGYKLIAEPTSFIVNGTFGPLADGEVSEVESWVREFAQEL